MLVLAFDCSSNSMSIALGKSDEKNFKIFESENEFSEEEEDIAIKLVIKSIFVCFNFLLDFLFV